MIAASQCEQMQLEVIAAEKQRRSAKIRSKSNICMDEKKTDRGGSIMRGAIIGDIISSRFKGCKAGSKFDLFEDGCCSTDAGARIGAVAEALILSGPQATPEEITDAVSFHLALAGRASSTPTQNSWFDAQGEPCAIPTWNTGIQPAACVASAGWLYDSANRTREVAKAITKGLGCNGKEVTDAECIAALIFLARNGISQADLREYAQREFSMDLLSQNVELSAIHPVEAAIVCALGTTSYEEAVRTALTLPRDTSAIAIMAGSLAEALYGIPDDIWKPGRVYLDSRIFDQYVSFNEVCTLLATRYAKRYDLLEGNAMIETAIRLGEMKEDRESGIWVLQAFVTRALEGGTVLVPYVLEDSDLDIHQVEDELKRINLLAGKAPQEGIRLGAHVGCALSADDPDAQWLMVFTSLEEANRPGDPAHRMEMPIAHALECVLELDLQGLVVNPNGCGLRIHRDLVSIMVDLIEQEREYEDWQDTKS